MENLLALLVAGLILAIFLKPWAWILCRPRSALAVLPPSPKALPLIGHLHLLLGKNLHDALANIAEDLGPCVLLRLGNYPHLVISSTEAAKEAIRVRDSSFSSRPVLTPGKIFTGDHGILWAPYGEYWRTIRKLCTLELLTMKQVELSRSARAEEIALVMAKLREASDQMQLVDLSQVISDATYSLILRKVVGKSYLKCANSEASRFKHLLKEVFIASGELYIGDTVPWLRWLDFRKAAVAKRLSKEVRDYMQKHIDDHRAQPEAFGHDFMSIMLQNELLCKSDDAIRALALDMIAGGTDTTAITVEWAMAELMNNPMPMSRLQEELREMTLGDQVDENQLDKLVYLSAVVKETLRLHPPGTLLLFQAAEDCQVMNYFVPAKTRVFINIHKMGRDDHAWKDPMKFKPERFLERSIDITGIRDFEMLPFGSGRRGCPGTQLGLRLVHFTLANLVLGFNWKNPEGTQLDMTEGTGLTTPRAVPLQLVPCTYVP